MSKNNFAFQGIKDVQIKYPRLERLFIPPLMFKVSWSNINSHNFFFYAFLIDFWATYLTIFFIYQKCFPWENSDRTCITFENTLYTSQSWDFADGDDANNHHVNQDVTPFRLSVYQECIFCSHTTIIIVSEILPFFSLLTEFLTCSRHIIH